MSEPMKTTLRWLSVFLFALLLGSSDLGAQLLDNTRFDTDVLEWTALSEATVEWDELDADASPTSGSARVTNLSSGPGDSNGALQCANGISEGFRYQVGAEVYIPGGQTETGWADILIQWHADAACSEFISLANTTSVPTTSPDTWLPVSGSFVAPAGSQSARIRLSVRKQEDGGSLAAHFDNVFLEPAPIFTDDFESGDTAAWSQTVP